MRRILRAPGRLVTRIRRFAGGLLEPLAPERDGAGRLTDAGNLEGVVLYGLVLVFGGFALAGLWPLALGIPGVALLAVGLGFNLRGFGRKG